MAEHHTILVTGATGKVGRQVVSQLIGTGIVVRAMARNPGSAGLPGAVEAVRGDLSEWSVAEALGREEMPDPGTW